MAACWAECLNRPLIGSTTVAQADIASENLRSVFLSTHGILPLRVEGETAPIVVRVDPLSTDGRESLRYALGGGMHEAIAPRAAILARLAELSAADTDPVDATTGEGGARDIERLRDLASDAPVVQWVNALIDRAVTAGASDIHLEPDETACNVRLRVDGALRAAQSPPEEMRLAAVSRIKLLAGLDISERRLPQDGRTTATVRGRRVDLRIATAPTPLGETIVIRILDPRNALLDLDELGFETDVLAQLRTLLAHPNGIVLVTGPTGAGKTTTLYAALQATISGSRKLMTVEDPVEYALPGVAQIQASHAIGLDFAAALQSILRHDPDVVMVGEIRNRETGEVAVEAALTGHLVLSTLHTNCAAATLTRLREMGLASYLLADSLRGVVAQRLVRRLCPDCAAPATLSRTELSRLGLQDAAGLRRHVGCPACSGEGYRGRVAINELLMVDAQVRELIIAEADETALSAAAVQGGMTSLARDGLRKAARGLTSIEEVLAVCGGI